MNDAEDFVELAAAADILGCVAAPIVAYDRAFRFAYANAAFCESVHKRWDELVGKPVAEVFPESPGRMSFMRTRLEQVLAGERVEPAELAYQIPGPDGRLKERFWRSLLSPLIGPDGAVTHVVQTGEDVTEQVLLRQQRDVIAAELEHRVRNTLTMAGSLAMVIGQSTPSVDAFIESFTDRLDSMGRNLAMISDHDWQGLPLRTVIDAELAQAVSPNDSRVVISGPDVILTMRSARWTALLAHELVKNAVRHGCFSVPGGSLRIAWTLEADRLNVDWVETGRKVSGVPQREGFGTQMLSLMPDVHIKRVFRDDGMSVNVKAQSSAFTLVDAADQRPPETLK